MSQENKVGNNKIKILKQSHQNNSSAANPHNTYLDRQEAEYLKNPTIKQNESFNLLDNILEWYIRTLGDELYKLAFINKEKYYRIKVFWPIDYETFQMNIQGGNSMQVENEKVKYLDNIRYYLNQFQNFEIEDYFDVIIFPKIDKKQNSLSLRILVNPFTYLLSDIVTDTSKFKLKASSIEGLELFLEYDNKTFYIANDKDFKILSDLTNFLMENYVIRSEIKDCAKLKLNISTEDLRKRIAPIIKEETRVVLYELYQDL